MSIGRNSGRTGRSASSSSSCFRNDRRSKSQFLSVNPSPFYVPPQIETLQRRIFQLEAEALRATCDASRAATRRLALSELTVQLEQLKRQALAAEVAR